MTRDIAILAAVSEAIGSMVEHKTPVCRKCGVGISIVRGRGMQCPTCYGAECVRMAAEMGAAVHSLIPCVFNGECAGKHPYELQECSFELHHVKAFARYAWQYAREAMSADATR
jgi:hypothetical protein